MKVICPKCQFENQADSTRVVCARCATIIEVRVDQGSSSGFDTNGKRQTARLPFAANSPNSGNLGGNYGSGNLGGNYGSGNSGPLSGPAQNRDVYATRVGDDFDDVLDIPRSAQNEFPNTAEATPVFEDVFSTNYDSSANYDFSSYEKKSSTPSGGFQLDTGGQRVTQDYSTPAEPEFMGWPVLPENSLDDEEEFVGGATSNRGGVILRVVLIVAVFGVLSFLAYYFLWNYIRDPKGPGDQATNNPATDRPSQPTAPGANSNPGSAVDNNPPKAPPATTGRPKTETPPGKEVIIPPIPRPPEGPSGPSNTPRQEQSQRMPDTPNRGNWTIQVASYRDRGDADKRVDSLKSANVSARAVAADIPGKGIYYRVQVGGFPSREVAATYGQRMRSENLVQEYIVVTIGKL